MKVPPPSYCNCKFFHTCTKLNMLYINIYFSVTVCIWYMRIKLIHSFKKRVLSTKAARSFSNCGNMYLIKPYIIKFLSRL